MTEDYGCKLCGKHFEEEEDLKTHGKDDHPEVQEAYPEIFDKKEEEPAEEIDQQEDKPVQSHDDWLEDLKGLKDDFATEQEKCAICNGEHPTNEHPVSETHEEETKTEIDPVEPKEAEEEGGADEPLSKVDSLSESYRFMSRDKRLTLFESLDFGQRDSAILSGLEWNELTRPIKVEASESYAKELTEEEEKLEKYSRVNDENEEEEENKAYESLYNLEKYHSSPDFKKKSLTCNRCNEAFYNINDRAVHFNEVHATEQEYELPDQCPFCKEIIQEPDTLDWHMQEEHGAHVPSTFTQTGLQGAMADTDFDSLESYKRATEGQGGTYGRSDFMLNPQHEDITTCVICGRDIDSHSNPNTDYRGMRGDAPPTDHYFLGGDQGGSDDKYDFESYKATEAKWECLDCDQEFDDAGKHQDETGHHNITKKTEEAKESRASDLRKEIKKKEQFINMASFENPMNMGYANDELQSLKDELESLGGEELELTEGEGGHQDLDDTTKYPDDPEEKAEEDTSDYEVDVDEYLKTGEPVQKIPYDKRADEEEDVELVPDKGEFLNMMRDIQAPPEKAEEDGYVDDSDNAEEKYVCPDCDEEFNSDEQLQGHQYSYYHGKYKDEGEGEDMPRNEMGGY